MVKHFELNSAAKYGDLSSLRHLIEEEKHPLKPRLLSVAAERGHLDCVRYLLPLVEPNEVEEGLINAAASGKTMVVAFLVAHCTQINTFNLSAFHACINNHDDAFWTVYPLFNVDNVHNRLNMARYEQGHPQSRLFYEAKLRENDAKFRETLLRETAGDYSTRVLKM